MLHIYRAFDLRRKISISN